MSLEAPIWTACNPAYTAFVDRIREDYTSSTVSLHLLQRLASLDECIQFLYPFHILINPLTCLKRAFLTPKNVVVDDFNVEILQQLPAEERAEVSLSHKRDSHHFPGLFYSIDSIKEDSEAPDEDISPDFLTLQTHNGVPPPHPSAEERMHMLDHVEHVHSERTCQKRMCHCEEPSQALY